jgi:hypothetical protein
MFTVLGAGASFIFLAASVIAGFVLWLFTKDIGFCAWAFHGMPIGTQPYRSAAGILTFFLIVALFWDRVPGARRIGLAALVWVSRLLWLAACATWVVAVATLVSASQIGS